MDTPGDRIAVLRALQLGDMLSSIPFFRSLRAANPDAHVTLIGLPWAHDLAERFDTLIDDVVEFPGWPSIPEIPFSPSATLSLLKDFQADPYDLAIDLQGSGLDTNSFIQLLGARESAGFYPPGKDRPGETFVPYPGHGTERMRLMSLASALGWPTDDTEAGFPLRPSDRDDFVALARELQLDQGDYCVVHTGARDPERRWSPQKFAAVADALSSKGMRVVLTGVESEMPQVLEVAARMTSKPEVICGRTTLGSLACLLAGARLLVSNDTGVAHLGAALDVRRIVIFTHSDPERWGAPESLRYRQFVEPTALANTCVHPAGTHRCLADACRWSEVRAGDAVKTDDVIYAALGMVGDRAISETRA